MKSKEYRAYLKMQRKYRKKLTAQAKNFSPWDYDYIWAMLKTMLENFEEYYRRGNNVFGEDGVGQNRHNEIKECLDIMNEIDNDIFNKDVDDYMESHQPSCIIENYITRSCWTNEETRCWLDLVRAADQKETNAYEHFFYLLGENMRGWWD